TVEAMEQTNSASAVSRAFSRLTKSGIAIFGTVVIVLLFLIGVFGPSLLVDQGPNSISSNILAAPSELAWLGTDELGRSVLTQMVYGVRTSLVVGLLAALSATLIGISIGSLAGYVGGRLDSMLMRITEMFQVMPTFILAAI